MILSTYHPTISAKTLRETNQFSQSHSDPFLPYEKSTLPSKLTVTTFNDSIISPQTQQLVCDYFQTLIENHENYLYAQRELLSDRDFNPIILFQRLTQGHPSNMLTRQHMVDFINGMSKTDVNSEKVKQAMPAKQWSFIEFSKRLLIGDAESAYLSDKSVDQSYVYRRIDKFPYPLIEKKFHKLITTIICNAEREDELKQLILKGTRDFNLRKLFQAILSGSTAKLDGKPDRSIESSDIKRLMTANMRLIEESRILEGLIKPNALGLSELSYERFAKIFTPKGKVSLISQPLNIKQIHDKNKAEYDIAKKTTINNLSQKTQIQQGKIDTLGAERITV